MKLGRLERLAGVCGVALGVAVYLVARSFPRPPAGGWMNDPTMWPQLLAIVLVVLSVPLLLRRGGAERSASFAGVGRGLVLLASGAVYVWLLSLAGYFTASMGWLVAVMLLAGERRWLPLVTTSLALTATGYLLFWKVMVIALPTGVLDEWLGLTRLYR